MLISRRKFNQGAVALSGSVAMPPVPVSMKRGSEDAYEAIISELVRVEEAAHKLGAGAGRSGAVSVTGQKLEAFVGHLDMQLSPFETASQVYREMRNFLKDKAREATEKTQDAVSRSLRDAVDQPVPEESVSESVEDETQGSEQS